MINLNINYLLLFVLIILMRFYICYAILKLYFFNIFIKTQNRIACTT